MDPSFSELELAEFTTYFVIFYDVFFFAEALVFPFFDGHALFFGVGTSPLFSVFAATIIASFSFDPLKHSLYFHLVLLPHLMVANPNHYNKEIQEAKKSSITNIKTFKIWNMHLRRNGLKLGLKIDHPRQILTPTLSVRLREHSILRVTFHCNEHKAKNNWKKPQKISKIVPSSNHTWIRRWRFRMISMLSLKRTIGDK